MALDNLIGKKCWLLRCNLFRLRSSLTHGHQCRWRANKGWHLTPGNSLTSSISIDVESQLGGANGCPDLVGDAWGSMTRSAICLGCPLRALRAKTAVIGQTGPSTLSNCKAWWAIASGTGPKIAFVLLDGASVSLMGDPAPK